MAEKVTENKLDLSVELSFSEDNNNYLVFEKPEYKMTEYVESNNYGKFIEQYFHNYFFNSSINFLFSIMIKVL